MGRRIQRSRLDAEGRRRTVTITIDADVPKEHRVPIPGAMGRRYNDLGSILSAVAPKLAAAAASAQSWVADTTISARR
jgi:hypothetical protein